MEREAVFSTRARQMTRSVIRELLKLTADPEVISFAGGLPAPETFPVDKVREAAEKVLREEAAKALQYGPTEGDIRLRADLAGMMREDGIDADPEHVIVLTASQQGLDLIGKVFFDPGDTAVVGFPTYLGAIQAFRSYQADLVGVELDDEGMRPDLLEKTLDRLESEDRRPKFIYLVPDFQNPAGVTIPEARRRQIIALARDRGYLLVEDTPYRQLRYAGRHQATFQSLAPDCVISLYTFSKILLPGFRLGWAYGPDWVLDKMVMAKQGTDLCSPPFTQAITHYVIESGGFREGLQHTIELYRERRRVMLESLDQELGATEGVTWTRPEGGLFLWLTLPEGCDTQELFEAAIAEKVAYVPGRAFYPPGMGGERSMRLNFSYCSEELIRKGVSRLAALIRKQLG
ncbi:PLP-dependent aminotransferase family protein [Candidatus Fermentibacterales bacterium]|nr:PLP-dependent aminotransferase family protein [Candidatus Fermentibacterales bacterium]